MGITSSIVAGFEEVVEVGMKRCVDEGGVEMLGCDKRVERRKATRDLRSIRWFSSKTRC